jgi:ferric-dicitrate binding protein FerR (iron transport regulator)
MNIDNDILAKYLSGNCSAAECEELTEWVESSEENKKHFSEMKNAWTMANITSLNQETSNPEENYKVLVQKITSASEMENAYTEGRFRIPGFLKIAAAILIAIGITALISKYVWDKPYMVADFHELVVPSGQQAQLTLPDGTKIWLNSKSKLTYPGTFTSETREVVLDGEGYFQVSHNPEKPFIVKTSHLDVKVLGTSFNITNYSDEDKITLALETGSISISEQELAENSMKLKPEEMAVYSKADRNIVVSEADSEIYKSWLKGQFKFRNLSFEDISRRLGRNFNVEFVFKNESVKKVRYNGSFYNYEPLSQILKIMQTNSAFRYRIVKDKVFIE